MWQFLNRLIILSNSAIVLIGLKLVLWDNSEGWDGEGGGKDVGGEFRMEGRMYTHGWFMSMYGKKHHNIVK